MMQHILVGLDGSSAAESILAYVASLAQGLGAKVTLLYVAQAPDEALTGGHLTHPPLRQLLERVEAGARSYLESVRGTVSAHGVPCQVAVVTGDPAEEIGMYAQREGADLVALATHGRSGMARLRFGSVADRVLHTIRTPLLIVRPTEEALPPTGVRRVVLPLDGSAFSEAAAPYAEHVAHRFGAPLIALRSIEPFNPLGLTGVDLDAANGTIASALAAVAAFLERFAEGPRRAGLTVEVAARLGSPSQMILDEAHAHAGSLVVMATQGRTGLPGWLLGSVARQVVYQAGTPVLVVRPTVAAPLAVPGGVIV